MFMIGKFQSPVTMRTDLRVSNTGKLHKHRQTSHKLHNKLKNIAHTNSKRLLEQTSIS